MLRNPLISAALALALGIVPLCAHAAARHTVVRHGAVRHALAHATPRHANTNGLALQVALDRAGFSPGIVDGNMGTLTRQAIRGFQEANGIKITGTFDAKTQAALGELPEATETVEVSEADAAGPFLSEIPETMAERAKLDGLHYTSIEEALAEKYHTTPAELRALNRGADLKSGSRIVVPAVRPAGMTGESGKGWDEMLAKLSVAKTQPNAARLVVDKSDRTVRAFDVNGKLLAQFPASIGSEYDPLPLGQWKIRGVSTLPSFNYNPELFWDAEEGDAKAKLPPGPNGPVGVVWIDLSKEHYGIHGTPEPQTVGRTASHGCIRLTNWDAAKLAQMVKAGTPAILQD